MFLLFGMRDIEVAASIMAKGTLKAVKSLGVHL